MGEGQPGSQGIQEGAGRLRLQGAQETVPTFGLEGPGLVLLEDRQAGIDTRLHGILGQQARAERMDGGHRGLFQVLQGASQEGPVGAVRTFRLLDAFAQAGDELPRGLLREGDGGDAGQGHALLLQQEKQTVHHQVGLAGTSRSVHGHVHATRPDQALPDP